MLIPIYSVINQEFWFVLVQDDHIFMRNLIMCNYDGQKGKLNFLNKMSSWNTFINAII